MSDDANRIVQERRFLNRGNSCYINACLQMLGTDLDFLRVLREHSCDDPCVACRLRMDLVDRTTDPVIAFLPETAIHRASLEGLGTAKWSLNQQD